MIQNEEIPEFWNKDSWMRRMNEHSFINYKVQAMILFWSTIKNWTLPVNKWPNCGSCLYSSVPLSRHFDRGRGSPRIRWFYARFFNADGSEAECKEMALAVARWAFETGIAKEKWSLKTIAGDVPAERLDKRTYRVQLNSTVFEADKLLQVDGKEVTVIMLNWEIQGFLFSCSRTGFSYDWIRKHSWFCKKLRIHPPWKRALMWISMIYCLIKRW